MGKPYHAVLSCTVPPDWRPTRVFHLPPSIADVSFYARRVPLNIAIEIARTHNRRRMQDAAAPVGTWLMVVRALKTRSFGNPNSRMQPPDPNSRRSQLRRLAEGGAA